MLFTVYRKPGLTPGRGQNIYNCDYDRPPNENQVCDVNVKDWFPCTQENNFNYHKSAPCVFIKLNKVIDFTANRKKFCSFCSCVLNHNQTCLLLVRNYYMLYWNFFLSFCMLLFLWRSVLEKLQKPKDSWVLNKFCNFYERGGTLTVYKKNPLVHVNPPLATVLSCLNSFHTIRCCFFKIHHNVLPSKPKSAKWFPATRFLTENFVCSSYLFHACF